MNAAAAPTPPKAPPAAILALLVVTIFWGGTFVWMKQGLAAAEAELGAGQERVGIGVFMALRFGLATLCLLAVPSARRGLTGAVWRGGGWIGGLLFGGFVLQMIGLTEIPPAVSAFLTSLYVLFTAIATASLERRGLRRALIGGVVLATIGAGFIRGRPELAFNLGELATVACAAVFALHILATDRITKRLAPMPVTLASFAWVTAGSLALTALAMLDEGAPAAGDLIAMTANAAFAVPLLLSSLLATLVALTLMNLYQRRLDPVRAAVLYALEPIWAALFGIACGTDAPTAYLWLGGLLLVAGNLVAELGQRGCPATSSES
jgi:drug/metabolite transporter (DMT)-like permease